MSEIRKVTVRFRMDQEQDRQAYELLQRRGKEECGSLSQAAIMAVNGFFDRKDHLTDDPYLETREKEDAFLARVMETIAAGMQTNILANLTALLQNMPEKQPSAFPDVISEQEEADLDAAMDFINSL